MCVHGPALLQSGFDFYAFVPCLDRVAGIHTVHDEVGMPVVVLILNQSARMGGQTRRQHVREHSRENGLPESVLKPPQTFGGQESVDIEEEVVDVLHGRLEVEEPEFVGQNRVPIEALRLNLASINGHSTSA